MRVDDVASSVCQSLGEGGAGGGGAGGQKTLLTIHRAVSARAVGC